VVRSGTPARAIPPPPASAYRRTMLLVLLLVWARRFRDERGAVATEYGLILTLVVLVTVLAITAFGIAVADMMDQGTEPF